MQVALLAEGVDRNRLPAEHPKRAEQVALLAEGVDRNRLPMTTPIPLLRSPSSRRAWIEISVGPYNPLDVMSPSSRRAWIEIGIVPGRCAECCVALLAEGVDRNFLIQSCIASAAVSPSSRRAWIEISWRRTFLPPQSRSPSSRRAWIEMTKACTFRKSNFVALLAEGVDRNCASDDRISNTGSRPPRGGRG